MAREPSDFFDGVITGAYRAAAAGPRPGPGPGSGLAGKLLEQCTTISAHGTTTFGAPVPSPAGPTAGPTETSTLVPPPSPLPVCRRGTISCFGDIMQVPPDVQRVVLETLMGPRLGDSGLRDAARLGMACRGWRQAYRELLLADVGLSIKVNGKASAGHRPSL